MFETLDVSKLEMFKLVKLLQLWNINFMVVTLDVLKFERSKLVKLLHS